MRCLLCVGMEIFYLGFLRRSRTYFSPENLAIIYKSFIGTWREYWTWLLMHKGEKGEYTAEVVGREDG